MKHFSTFFLAATLAVGCLTSCGKTLSEKRANYVRDLLVNKYGASSSNIEVVAEGDRNNIFDTPAKNRVVTIKVK